MDREGQLRNVAFGGSWSQQIPEREALRDALALLHRAAEAADARDPRRDKAVNEALLLAGAAHPKGLALIASWTKAASQPLPGQRVQDLTRLARLFEDASRGLLK